MQCFPGVFKRINIGLKAFETSRLFVVFPSISSSMSMLNRNVVDLLSEGIEINFYALLESLGVEMKGLQVNLCLSNILMQKREYSFFKLIPPVT